jgi:signal transduction histidine kinase/PAS domain-containing protein
MVDDLDENEFPFQEIVTNTCVISFVLDSDSKLIQANKFFYRSLGYTQKYFEKNNLSTLLTEKSTWPRLIDGLRNVEDSLTTNLKIFTKNGKPLFIKSNVGYKDGKVYVVGIDVTDDIQKNETLSKVTEMAKIGGWTYNPSENKISWTDCLYEILDIPGESSMTRELFWSFVHPDSVDFAKKSIEDMYEKHLPYDIEIQMITRSGVVIWVRIVSDIEVFNGEVAYVHGVMQDITKFKQQSISLEETKINMELALRAMNSGYFTHDLVTDNLHYSSTFREKMSFPAIMTEDEFRDFIHPEDRDEASKQHDREIATENVYYVNAYRMKSFTGEYKHFEVHGFKVFDSANKPVKLVGNLIDVEDKYRLNHMEDKHRYHMKTLLDNTFVRSIMLDKDWTIIGLDGVTTQLFAKRLGYNPILKKANFKDTLTSHDRLKFNIIERVMDKGKVYRNKVYLDLFESDRTYYDGLFKPILDYSNKIDGYVFYFFDLTDEVKLQDDLQSYQNKLRTVHHFKNNIIHKIDYEVKTPLNDLLQTTKKIFEKESVNAQDRELIRAQQESADLLMHTFDTIINSSIYEDNFFIIKDNIDLTAILENMRSSTANRASLEGLDFEFINFESSVVILGDAVFLKQSFENLTDHAFRSTRAGLIAITTAIKDNHAEITLEDTGEGIPQHKLNEVFEPFKEVLEGDTRTFEGLGLGLTFAVKYIEGIGGHIHVESVVGKGTKFVLALPLAESPK